MRTEVIVYDCDRCGKGDMTEEFMNVSGSKVVMARGRKRKTELEKDLCDSCTADLIIALGRP